MTAMVDGVGSTADIVLSPLSPRVGETVAAAGRSESADEKTAAVRPSADVLVAVRTERAARCFRPLTAADGRTWQAGRDNVWLAA